MALRSRRSSAIRSDLQRAARALIYSPLRGKQVLLCSLRDEDSEQLYEWINDRELVSLSSHFEPVSSAAHATWFANIRRRADVRIFGIRLLSNDRLVGSCQFH